MLTLFLSYVVQVEESSAVSTSTVSKCKSKKEEVCDVEEHVEETNPGNTSAHILHSLRGFANCLDRAHPKTFHPNLLLVLLVLLLLLFLLLIARNTAAVRVFAKSNKKLRKSKKTWIDLIPHTHPHPIFFGNPSLTWTDHSNHNNQQLLYRQITHGIQLQNTHGIQLQNITTGLGLFWDDFPQKKTRVRPGRLDPHFHSNLGFLEFFFFAKPLKVTIHMRVTVDSLVRETVERNCVCDFT